MVPLTMLLTLLIMRQTGIELERMSLATLIISLGLLVDNGIVMAEEIGRRLSVGQQRLEAAIGTGRDMAMPLLASSLTTIFAFMPLMLAENEAGEYMRSLSLVIAISLLASWFVAMTATPLFCYWGLRAPPPVDEEAAYDTPFYKTYRSILEVVLKWRIPFLALVIAALLVAVWGLRFVPNIFFPASDRVQLQVYVDLPAGSNTYGTGDVTSRLSAWLADRNANPDVESNVAYVANGGPRFYLGLNPIDPYPHRAFIIANVASRPQLPEVLARIEAYAAANLPEARVTVKPMSMGASEAGLVEFRIVGPDSSILAAKSDQLKAILRQIEGTKNIQDDWENRVVKIIVDVDQARARRAGVTSESVAGALNAILSGAAVTDYREGDTVIPVYLRAEGDQRTNIDRLRTLNIAKPDGKPVPLLQVADFRGEAEFGQIKRRNLERVITVKAKHDTRPAAWLDAEASKRLAELELPPGYRIEKGGEIEGSAEAQGALFANMPLAFALIVLVLVGQFNSFRKPLVILAVIPLTMIGVTVGLLVMPDARFSFTAILGLLSLAGIIINNAIVLIDRVNTETANGLGVHDAIMSASVKRLRPILMTTVTTIFGLMPIIISGDVLFYDMAVVISGGLLVGTILTLGVVPVLYSLLFRDAAQHSAQDIPEGSEAAA
jgi:multidrug efflux pump subunit AcrB